MQTAKRPSQNRIKDRIYMNICTAFTQHGQNQRRMVLLFSRVRRLAGLPMAVLMVLLLFGIATFEAAAQAVSSAASQSIDPVLADATRPDRIQPEAPAAALETAPPTFFPHPDGTRYFIAGQANIIFQAHGPFHSPYEGTNSLLGRGEYKTSLIGTLYMGAELVRNPSLGPMPYLARVQVHQTIGFSSKTVEAERGPFSLATEVPERRLELRVGKMGLPDFFDLNSVGTDSHLQFLNWTTDNNGAWDYAADTRGYTYAAVAEYDDKNWSARYGLATMPTVANGINFDWSLKRASGQNTEVEWRHGLFGGLLNPDRKGVVRALSYVNHGHMGLYRAANAAYLAKVDATPDITKHETFGAVKYGFGLNAEQELTEELRVFGRFGWNEGQHESYVYTEVDQTVELGGDLTGKHWGRANDKVGLAFVSNAIKRDHQQYLRLGGLGFLLGDGNLNYAREDILEGYYTLHTWRGLSYALDAQYIAHPGYNQDRGPVLVESVRMHVDF